MRRYEVSFGGYRRLILDEYYGRLLTDNLAELAVVDALV